MKTRKGSPQCLDCRDAKTLCVTCDAVRIFKNRARAAVRWQLIKQENADRLEAARKASRDYQRRRRATP